MRLLVVSALWLLALPAMGQDAPAAFGKCLPCHAIGEEPRDKVGPHLNGVLDRLAGGVDGYAYSPAMQAARNAGLHWDRVTLTRYLKSPKHLIPGTSMTFYGMASRDEIDAIIDYLASFDALGGRVAP